MTDRENQRLFSEWPKPSARLFVSLVMDYVDKGLSELALSAVRSGVSPEEGQELLARLDKHEGDAARAVLEVLRSKRRSAS